MNVKRRWKIAIATAALLAIVAVISLTTADSEPSYNGHTLSEWLTYDFKPGPVTRLRHTEAILKIGTNALPTLLRWIQYDPPQWKIASEKVAERVGLINFDSRTKCSENAMKTFRILGTNAASAIPALTNLALGSQTRHTVSAALVALGYIGEPGRTALSNLLSKPNVDKVAIRFAFNAAEESRISPTVARCLNDPDPEVRILATNVLREVAPELLITADQ